MYEQLLEETAVLPAVWRECHKINVGAAQEQIEITRRIQQEEPFSLIIIQFVFIVIYLPHWIYLTVCVCVCDTTRITAQCSIETVVKLHTFKWKAAGTG